jgi:type I restriction enzyme S subunit
LKKLSGGLVMGLNKYKLGELIKPSTETNHEIEYGVENVRGISIKKIFIETKANMKGVSLKPYSLVKPDSFAYVTTTSRNGEKTSIAHNDTTETYIVSSSYVVFNVSRCDLLSSDYLYIYFNRPEFDRYARFNSWGSARETFTWEDMCDIEIDIPRLPIQQKYVNVYNAMLANQRSYENGLEDLKLVCDAYIENLRREIPCERIEKYVTRIDQRVGNDKIYTNNKGISIEKEFMPTRANMKNVSLRNYKIVLQNDFAFNVNTARMGEKLAIALCREENCIVSVIYEVFRTKQELMPEYLMMWFKRTEFDRFVRYNSWGSARETFTWNDIIEVKIPIPDIKIQKSIVNIYNAYVDRKGIKEKLKAQTKDICPILIKGSLEEDKKV